MCSLRGAIKYTYNQESCGTSPTDTFLAPALKELASAAQGPGSSPDEYKAHIEKYFASKLIPGAPSARYAYSQNSSCPTADSTSSASF